jgi:choline dehydrogenase-like flavoprotein
VRFFDLRQMDENSLIETDLCIVGSGPAGMSIAHEFAATDVEVLVLESGGVETDAATQTLCEFENTGARRHLDPAQTRVRIFGGTSHVWTGRCAPFDAMDFEERSWVAYSGWPFTRADIDSYLERAGVYLGLGPHCYDETLWRQFKVPKPRPPLDGRFLAPIFWQFSKRATAPRSAVDFARDLPFPRCDNVNVILHSNLTQITTASDGSRIDTVEISTLENKRSRVRARAVVLACGGIENARLLLASNRIMPHGVGNEHDLVGRFLMDHPLCVLGHFDTKDSAPVRDRFGHYWLDDPHGRHTYLHGLTLSKDIQTKERLLGCAAFIEEFDVADDDPWQTMRRFASHAKSRRLSRALFQDGKSLLFRSGEIGHGLYRRLGKHRPQLARANRIDLHCLVEQTPDPESRLTLSSEKRDALGMPLSRINWKIGEAERLSARRMIQLVCQEFPRLELPIPRPSPWLTGDELDYRFIDKAHPTGTTRLSHNPREGVVDANLQVHNVRGLFIAGSSVFPTSGTANPTLMIVALSLRLADWLKFAYFKPHFPAHPGGPT